MSGQTYKTSRSYIIPAEANQRLIYVLDSQNPETILAKILRTFFEEMGYSEIYPNFNSLRIGTVHPFAILLAQEVLEQPKSTNLFPSITVADSNASEDTQTLSDGYAPLVFYPEDIANLDGYRQAKEVFVSDTGWQKIKDTVAANGHVIGIKRTYTTRNTMDFNIWSDNKDITSFLFDMVCHFLIQKKADIHNTQDIDIGTVSGRRTGDINLDFGMLLYGGNAQTSILMDHTAVLFDTSIKSISEIDVKTLPEYFTLEAVNV